MDSHNFLWEICRDVKLVAFQTFFSNLSKNILLKATLSDFLATLSDFLSRFVLKLVAREAQSTGYCLRDGFSVFRAASSLFMSFEHLELQCKLKWFKYGVSSQTRTLPTRDYVY